MGMNKSSQCFVVASNSIPRMIKQFVRLQVHHILKPNIKFYKRLLHPPRFICSISFPLTCLFSYFHLQSALLLKRGTFIFIIFCTELGINTQKICDLYNQILLVSIVQFRLFDVRQSISIRSCTTLPYYCNYLFILNFMLYKTRGGTTYPTNYTRNISRIEGFLRILSINNNTIQRKCT